MMRNTIRLHENFHREETRVATSNRSFGMVIAAFFLLLAAFLAYHDHVMKTLLSLGVALAFLLASFSFPQVLSVPNRAWTRFGLFLHKITNPALMLFIYLTAIVPMGLLLKLCKKDPLRRRFDATAKTYWISRAPGPPPETMRNQF